MLNKEQAIYHQIEIGKILIEAALDEVYNTIYSIDPIRAHINLISHRLDNVLTLLKEDYDIKLLGYDERKT